MTARDPTYTERVAEADESIARLRVQLESYQELRDDLAQRAAHEVTEGLANDGVRRSELTPLQKHLLIRKLGKDEYMQLPW